MLTNWRKWKFFFRSKMVHTIDLLWLGERHGEKSLESESASRIHEKWLSLYTVCSWGEMKINNFVIIIYVSRWCSIRHIRTVENWIRYNNKRRNLNQIILQHLDGCKIPNCIVRGRTGIRTALTRSLDQVLLGKYSRENVVFKVIPRLDTDLLTNWQIR